MPQDNLSVLATSKPDSEKYEEQRAREAALDPESRYSWREDETLRSGNDW